MPRPDPGPAQVLYDAECGFCRWSVAALLRLDSRGLLVPVAIQSVQGQDLLAGVPEDLRLASAHCCTPGVKVLSGGDAAGPIAERLPGGSPVAWVAARAPGLMRFGYGAVASRRSSFGRWISASHLAAADRTIESRSSHGSMV